MTTEEILKQCTIDGNIVRLPKIDLDRKTYMEIAKKLNLIGGTWKGVKIQGFQFASDPSDLLESISSGTKVNLKKEFQFFATPSELADYLIELAEIKPHTNILEPSAGQGAIVNAIHKVQPNLIVDWCELMEVNQIITKKIKNTNFICHDFLKLKDAINKKYDYIIGNPPFHKNYDILHIYEMYNVLKEGGRLVSVASVHWKNSENKLESKFKIWLNEKGANVIDVEPGTFKESGTNVPTCIIIINKNAN